MKRFFMFLFAVALLNACNEIVAPEEVKHPMQFDLSVSMQDDSKAGVKTDWENGDVVFVFFKNIPTKYIKLAYNGTGWDATYPGGAFEEADFTASEVSAEKKMTAVHFPYSDVTVTYSSEQFNFTRADDLVYHYYMSVTADYTVSETTVSGSLPMEKPDKFVQFLVNGISSEDAGRYKLLEPHLTPKACSSVSLDGTVNVTAHPIAETLTTGYALDGFYYDGGDVSGVLFGGYLSTVDVATDYVFELVEVVSADTPYAKGTNILKGTRTIGNNVTLILPSPASWTWYQWISMGYVGSAKWATGNLYNNDIIKETGNIVAPTANGSYYSWMRINEQHSSYDSGTDTETAIYYLGSNWRMPTSEEYQSLMSHDSGTFSSTGVTVKAPNGLTLFFPAAGFSADGETMGEEYLGYYWTSDTADPLSTLTRAYAMTFYAEAAWAYEDRHVPVVRSLGCSIRPVYTGSY